jgi:predicted nucleic acid-binding protein
VLGALLAEPRLSDLRQRLAGAADIHAPYLIDVEVVQSLRRLSRLRQLSEERAETAVDAYRRLRVVHYPHVPLLDRIWELRANVSAYDAAYVALAEALDAPLLTCDARLANAPGHAARVELHGQ